MDNYRQEKLGEVEDTFREFGTSLSQEKIEEIGEWYILEIEKLKKKMEEAGDAFEELFVSQGLFEDIEGDWEEQEKKNKFIALYWEAVNTRLCSMFLDDMVEVTKDIHFKEDYEWDNYLDAVAALAEKWYDWVC